MLLRSFGHQKDSEIAQESESAMIFQKFQIFPNIKWKKRDFWAQVESELMKFQCEGLRKGDGKIYLKFLSEM